MTVDITPIESGGQHWVNVIIGGHEMERRGPFPDADAAEAMAARLARTMHAEVRMRAAAGGR